MSDDQRVGRFWFLADLKLCESYLRSKNRVPVCDGKVDGLLIPGAMRHAGLPEVSAHFDVLDRVKVFERTVMVDAVKADPSLVWITCGTQLGVSFGQGDDNLVLAHKRLVGVAGASALSGAYGSLALYEWDAKRRYLGGCVARFDCGQQVEC